ncbi:MAG TPA: outer membrane protein assembly factor BamB, partial [Porticoccaceae bacterium]|nr:outer membrane protein assembly factor BamB [Porticoccaceae bacterium]
GTATPVVVGNMAILGLANGELVALNLLSGELLWETKFTTGEGKTELERIVDVNTPVVVGDIIYASSYQGKVGA